MVYPILFAFTQSKIARWRKRGKGKRKLKIVQLKGINAESEVECNSHCVPMIRIESTDINSVF